MHTYIVKRALGLTALAVLMFTVPSVARADAGDHVLRITLDYFEPTGGTYTWLHPEVPPGFTGYTSQIDTEPQGSFGFAVDYEYRYSDLFGIGVSLARTEAEMEITHYVALRYPPHYTGDLAMVPLTLSPLFHLVNHEALDVYCGPLLGYVFMDELKTEDYGFGTNAYGVKDRFTYGALVGLDIPLGNTNWLLTSSIRYMVVRAEIDEPYQHVEDMNARIDIDPIVFQAGIGYTF